ncbi:MAG: hypothetical protein GWN58_38235 [Anaerolineae bacterium]|nr:hypothetical protein [Anaerolineae bacterium]
MKKQRMRVLLRNLVVELIVYGVLVAAYSTVVLRMLGKPLAQLFHSNLGAFAVVSLMLIVAQGALLDALTSFLLDKLRMERP